MKDYLVHSKNGSKYRRELPENLVLRLDKKISKEKKDIGALILEIDNIRMIIDFVNTKEDILENDKRERENGN